MVEVEACGARTSDSRGTYWHGDCQSADMSGLAFKLIKAAQAHWRAVNAPQLVTLVRAGATFVNGKHVERPEDQGSRTAA
jgi:hypothetical protein